MIPFDSAALDQLWQTLGLGRSGNVQTPQLEDGSLVMTVPILPDIARRSSGLLGTGWRFAILRGAFTDGDEAGTASVDPYAPGTAIANYPSPVPQGLDVWLHGASIVLGPASGASQSDFTGAILSLNPTGDQQAWGEDHSGSGVVANAAFPLAAWTGNLNINNNIIARGGDGSIAQFNPGVRIPRGATLDFDAQVTIAVGETFNVDCYMILGTFPAALGSDAQK